MAYTLSHSILETALAWEHYNWPHCRHVETETWGGEGTLAGGPTDNGGAGLDPLLASPIALLPSSLHLLLTL